MNREQAKALTETTGAGITNTKITSASLEITVHRAATNTDEHYGLVSYYNQNPIKHYYVNLLIWLRGKHRQWQQLSQTRVKK